MFRGILLMVWRGISVGDLPAKHLPQKRSDCYFAKTLLSMYFFYHIQMLGLVHKHDYGYRLVLSLHVHMHVRVSYFTYESYANYSFVIKHLPVYWKADERPAWELLADINKRKIISHFLVFPLLHNMKHLLHSIAFIPKHEAGLGRPLKSSKVCLSCLFSRSC